MTKLEDKKKRREAPHTSEIRELSKELFEIIDACHFSEVENRRIERAFHLAMRLHATQEVRSDGPYTHHIMRTTRRVIAIMHRAPDADCVIAALLHDGPEDFPNELRSILSKGRALPENAVLQFNALFGRKAAEMVYWLTKPRHQKGTREQQYRVFLKRIVENGGNALIIKIADFLDNASTLDEKPPALARRLAEKWRPAPRILIDAFNEYCKTTTLIAEEERKTIEQDLLSVHILIESILASTHPRV